MANATLFLPLSGSVQGQGVLVVATATPGTTIHTSDTTGATMHQLWVNAYNAHTADVVLTLEYGDATTTRNIKFTVPFQQGLWVILDGLPLTGASGVALTVKAFAGTANVISLYGHYFDITP